MHKHTVFQRVKKVSDFFARFTNATFFVKPLFTKNLAMLVKKADKTAVFDGYLSNSSGTLSPRAPLLLHCFYFMRLL